MMKKLIALFSALAVAFAVAGCANSSQESASSEAADSSSADAAAEGATSESQSGDPSAAELDEEMTVEGVTWKADADWVMNASTAGLSFTYMTGSDSDATVCALVDIEPADSQNSIEAIVEREANLKKNNDSFASDAWKELSQKSENGLEYAVYQEDMQYSDEEPTTYYKGYVAKDGVCRIAITSPDESIVDAMLATVSID